MSQHIISLRTNFIVFGTLMALLVLTVAAAVLIDAGPSVEVPIALTIAIVKAVIIMMYFMHLKFSNKLTWLFAGASTLWLVIFVVFTLADFLSRSWLDAPVVRSGPTLFETSPVEAFEDAGEISGDEDHDGAS